MEGMIFMGLGAVVFGLVLFLIDYFGRRQQKKQT